MYVKKGFSGALSVRYTVYIHTVEVKILPLYTSVFVLTSSLIFITYPIRVVVVMVVVNYYRVEVVGNGSYNYKLR